MSKCVKCLAPTPLDAFLHNDHICDVCSDAPETYPLASHPHHVQYSPKDERHEQETAISDTSPRLD